MGNLVSDAEKELISCVVRYGFCYICDTEYTDGVSRKTPVCIHVMNELELDKIQLRDKRHQRVLRLLCNEFYSNYCFGPDNAPDLLSSQKENVFEEMRSSYDRIAEQESWLNSFRKKVRLEEGCTYYLKKKVSLCLLNLKDAIVKEEIEKAKQEMRTCDPDAITHHNERLQRLYELHHEIAEKIGQYGLIQYNKIMNKNNDEPVAMVFKTKDYDKFSFLSQNREPDHVKALISSFKERLVPNAILCNDKFQIIDGQNRFLALREMGKPILYYCIEGLDIYDVASLNSFGKNWSSMDFIKMWAELGKEQYQNIISFAETYTELNLNSILIILSDSVAAQQSSVGSDSYAAKDKSRASARNKLKLGEFEIKDINHAHYVARCIMQYKPFAKPGKQIHKQTAFVSAMVKLLRNKDFDNNELVRKAGLYPSLFYRCINANEYILMLEELWNYRRQKKVRFEY